MQLSTKWEVITRTLKYVLGSRNDDLLTIGGQVSAVPSIEHHLVGGLTLFTQKVSCHAAKKASPITVDFNNVPNRPIFEGTGASITCQVLDSTNTKLTYHVTQPSL